MAFSDDLTVHADRIRARTPHITGEESTKQALVVPLLQVLGYDVFDPREVRPEYVADFAVKKAGQFEKIDYAIYLNGVPAIFIECKPIGAPLEDHSGQLSRYFNATPNVRVAIITDGRKLRVFTDMQTANIMDKHPWLDIDLLALRSAEIEALRRFRRADFSPTDVVSLAEEMLYYNAITTFLAAQLREPSESFVRYIAGELQSAGRVTAKVVERLSPIVRKAIQSVIVEHVARSFDRAPDPTPEPVAPVVVAAPAQDGPVSMAQSSEPARGGVTSTKEELESYASIIRWIHETHPAGRVAHRDSKTYFTIHQENLRKWFARLMIERKPMWIALRHVKPDEAKQLAPGVEVLEGGGFGDCRFLLAELGDLGKVRTAILASYSREAARVADDGEPEPGPVPGN